METQEQKMVEQLSMRRMEIEMLRCEVLFRYYERLLGLDVINDRDEVKSIMTCINTLERYARKYEPKEPTVEPVPVENGGSGGVVCESKRGYARSCCVGVGLSERGESGGGHRYGQGGVRIAGYRRP